MILSLLLTTIYFLPTDNGWKLPAADLIYVCGAHTAGAEHANLPIPSGTTVDFDCPGNPGSIDGKGYSAGLVLRDVQDVRVLSPRITNVGRGILIDNADRVTIQGGEIHHTLSLAAIELRNSSRDVTIEGVTIHDGRNGIWAGTPPTEVLGHQRLRIVGNVISDSYNDRDSHGIGLQTVNASTISRNVITRTDGPAIAMYWWNGPAQMQSNVIESNTIFGIRQSGRTPYATAPRGIDLGGSNGTGTGRWNNRVRRNTIVDVAGEALYLKGSVTAPDQYPLEVTENYVRGSVLFGETVKGATRPIYLRPL